MFRTFTWPPIVSIIAMFVGCFVGWPWLRDRQATANVDALIVEFNDHAAHIEQQAGSLPEVPEMPTKAELAAQLSLIIAQLEEITGRVSYLSERAEDLFPKAGAEKRQQLKTALEQSTARLVQVREKYKERVALLRSKMEALNAAAGKG